MTGFVIHALPVLRGILALSPLPGTGGDYAGDLAHLKDWQPAMVMTLATLAEMVAAGAGELGHDVTHVGTRWVHLPVPDYGVPDAAGDARWRKAAPVALSALRGGGRVLIQCRGGCGRSGMATLRLMITAGEAPESALARLRDVRPCAVETKAQMRWAMRDVGQSGAGG
ncbi:protein phosphatase [Roseovarius sp. Pro17]|uniref:protein phosphatase n=1 Tax=Roseovarius sp. Pro17 TaxID=3108175 RepID=UPI002D7874A0|nr:protein phosphatase [Roseovarius sp. Pro17]